VSCESEKKNATCLKFFCKNPPAIFFKIIIICLLPHG
jgi:hypothetical protein